MGIIKRTFNKINNIVDEDTNKLNQNDPNEILDVNLDQLFIIRTRRNNLVEQVHGILKEYKPNLIDNDRIESMLRNGVISSGLVIIKAPLVSIFNKATFESKDPIIKAFFRTEVASSFNG